jgi:mRNA-degrading endonuclease RelE of RelBE toxin-antitoxin system
MMTILASEQVQTRLAGLPPEPKRRVRAALRVLATSSSGLDTKALRQELEGFYRLRVDDHRIVYRLKTSRIISLEYADLREVVYETFKKLRALSDQ